MVSEELVKDGVMLCKTCGRDMENSGFYYHEEIDDYGAPCLICYEPWSCVCGRVIHVTGQEYINDRGELVSIYTGTRVIREGEIDDDESFIC